MSGAVLMAPATAGAAEATPALVHATPENECKLNVRAGTDVGSPLLGTLTCDNYTTCTNVGDVQCGPFVTGGVYSCVGADKKQLTDNRWAEVNWRSPQKSYIAVGCAAFRA
ncbi:hypothetical protein FPZ12_015420 [Amycolatopsis acidicola]|uniref:Uncharacterized protein n=1 Tax=Amycolatopsis acidicola TaxID=2596893 RepID=A0A5N0V7Y7_9PSEU|nr:hypothetical protein [Amycolatopsis acidicola]KAA9161141.1 hypothetical protein FPZ12_015420 [Amycolatopsis acidicola]